MMRFFFDILIKTFFAGKVINTQKRERCDENDDIVPGTMRDINTKSQSKEEI